MVTCQAWTRRSLGARCCAIAPGAAKLSRRTTGPKPVAGADGFGRGAIFVSSVFFTAAKEWRTFWSIVMWALSACGRREHARLRYRGRISRSIRLSRSQHQPSQCHTKWQATRMGPRHRDRAAPASLHTFHCIWATRVKSGIRAGGVQRTGHLALQNETLRARSFRMAWQSGGKKQLPSCKDGFGARASFLASPGFEIFGPQIHHHDGVGFICATAARFMGQ